MEARPQEARPQDEWRVLCEQAAKEEDPKRLVELVQEINRLLEVPDEKKPVQHAHGPNRAAS